MSPAEHNPASPMPPKPGDAPCDDGRQVRHLSVTYSDAQQRVALGVVAPGLTPLRGQVELPNGLRVGADGFGWVCVEARTAAGWTGLFEGEAAAVRDWLIARLRDQAAALGVALDLPAPPLKVA